VPQNDCHLINIFENRVEKVEMKGELPEARAYHELKEIKPNLYCLFGGKANHENK